MADGFSSAGGFGGAPNTPESVKARVAAARALQAAAASSSGPYTSGAVTALKGLEGLMGGLQERQAYQQAMQGQMAGNASMIALANALGGGGGGGMPAPSGGAPMPSAMPMGQGGAGSDAVASGTARNPGGYDPKATEALIRARAPSFGIDPDTAVKVARSEGLNVYHGDGGSSFGPFQLHYGGVAGGGNRVGGLGDVFTRQTGLDARDPSTVPQQVDFALSQAAKGGWGPWHGAQRVGLGNFAGVGQGGGASTVSADMPAANARPVSMAGLPPGVTPAMWAASQNTATDGNALRRGDETPPGTKPYVPGSTPGPAAAPSSPPAPFDPEGTGAANYAPGAAPLMGTTPAAMAQALQTFKPPLGQAQAAIVPPPVTAATPDAPPPPSILPPVRPPSGDVASAPVVPPPQGAMTAPKPSLDAVTTAAMAKAGYDTTGLPMAQPAVVPPPQGSLTAPGAPGAPPTDPVGAGLAAGKDVALDPVVPDPQGSMVPAAPSSPNGILSGPQSDAAMGNDAGSMPTSLPGTAPLPPPGAQSRQAPADAASAAAAAAAPPFDPEGTGPANYPASSPGMKAALAKVLGGSGPAPTPAAPRQGLDVGDPGLDAMRASMTGQGGPAAPPLPSFAQAGAPGPTPMPQPPQPGTGAALPQTGPMPPPGAQSMGAGSSLPQTGPMPPPGVQSLAAMNPDAPAPNAVQAGPQPIPPAVMARALGPQQFGGSGTNAPAGNSPTADPSSAQNFMRQEMARQLGGGAPSIPPAAMPTPAPAAAPAPTPSSGPMGGSSPMGGLMSMFGGGAGPGAGAGGMLGGLFGGGGQGGMVPASPPTGGPASMPAGGAPSAPMAGQGGAPSAGSYDQARAAAAAIMSNPYASSIAQEAAAKVLFPQVSTVTGADGKVYAFNPATRQMSLLGDVGAKFTPNESLYQGGRFTQAPDKPMDLAPGHTAVTFGANNQAIPQVRAPETPEFKQVDGTGTAMDSRSGNQIGLAPGAGAFNTSIKLPGGTEVPIRVTPGANGGQPRVEYLTPGGAPGQGGDPLGGVQPLVDRAQTMQAQGAAQTKEAEGQVAGLDKLAASGVEARAKVADLEDLKRLSNGLGAGAGPMVAKWLGDHGYVTKGSSDVEAYQGLAGYIATQMRQAGSGALRTAEMDRFQADLGNMQMTPGARLDAINRAQRMFGRVGDMGDIAANSRIAPQSRVDQIHTLAAQPYGDAPAGPQGGVPGTGQAQAPQASGGPVAGAPQAAVQYLRQNPGLAAQFDAKYGAGASASILGR